MRRLLLAFTLLAAASPAAAQDPAPPDSTPYASVLPRDVATRVAAMYNRDAAIRTTGRLDIPAEQVVGGDVAVLGGPLVIAGRVRGSVVVVNGDAEIRPGAQVDGDLVVVGGLLRGRSDGLVGGDVVWHREPLDYRLEQQRLVLGAGGLDLATDLEAWTRRWRRPESASRLVIGAGTYNRVEGLPVQIGPSFRHHDGWGRARLDVYGIFRSANSFEWEDENLGYDVHARSDWVGTLPFGVSLRAYDVVSPVERWHLRDTEVGLASFFLHKDYRDYYDRKGAGGSVRVGPESHQLELGIARERWGARDERDPWTLFRSGRPWRPNPDMDQGVVNLLTAALTLDTRTDAANPWSGWLIAADIEHGRSGALALAPASPLSRLSESGPVDIAYTRAFVDLRRYNRVSPRGQLNLRMVAGGWLAGDDLPLQRRLSLGGPGTLPGFDFRRARSGREDVLQCGSDSAPDGLPAECDRVMLVQAEYRGDLHLRLGSRGDLDLGRDGGWRFDFERPGAWVVFTNAGRGWLVGGERVGELQYGSAQFPPLNTFRTDVGAGLDFGLFGLYVAKSVSHTDEPVNFFIRLRHRF